MKKILIDQSFDVWINNYQKTKRTYNIKTFYVFVKNVLRDGKNINKHNGDWLIKKIQDCKKFSKDDAEYFVELFLELKDFYYSQPFSNRLY